MQWIEIEEASEHNLKAVSTKIPRNRFVVFTGLSGSGKSSLAIDTLFKEGQRRFVESLSSYARQFLGRMEKPRVKAIKGLSPAICIEQKTSSSNPRSTVATVTEIMDYLRILYASIGIPHCPSCGKEVLSLTGQQIVEKIMDNEEGRRFKIVAPIIIKEKGTFTRLFNELKKEGYNRIEVDGEEYLLDEEIPKLDKNYKHDISAVIDRLRVKEGIEGRLNEAVEISLRRAEGRVRVDYLDEESTESVIYHEFAGCIECGISIGELNPRIFSFNSPLGACSQCTGLGFVHEIDPELIIADRKLSIRDGGIAFFSSNASESSWSIRQIEVVVNHFGGSLDIPIEKLPKKAYHAILYGSGEKIKFKFENDSGDRSWKYESERETEGLISTIKRRYKQTKSDGARRYYEKFMANRPCPTCKGQKLKPSSLGVLINDKNIMEINQLSVGDAWDFFNSLDLSEREKKIASQVLKEIQGRLGFLREVGLEYLTLDRSSASLSGGESQRIRLATQIGSKLVGVLYVLDEPSIGLHQRDNERLLNTFFELRDLGNTIVVIEHDDDTIESADFILDLGPEAGVNGGEVVGWGAPDDIARLDTITGKYLRREWDIGLPEFRREPNGQWIHIKGVEHNNLKKIDVSIPLGVMTVVSGVSGSGKSSLISDVLWKALAKEFHGASDKPGKHKEIIGLDNLDKVIMIDQNPIGRTPRSNPSTYTKIFDHIRAIFAETSSAKLRGYTRGRFSFNVKGGRCEACSGNGYNKIEMSFMGDVYVTCDVCKGKRYNADTLEITYKGKNIAEVLDMSIAEAHEFFKNIPKIKRILDTLMAVGCGYLKLGQSSTTLSGGEAQRIKLSRQLGKRVTGQTLILLDEPTTGLSKHDVKKLLEVLHTLVNQGNSILIIEHNLDVIKNADWIIDLGPEGGIGGGEVIATGTPEKITRSRKSYTGKYLKAELNRSQIHDY
ncbi:MAG: excinuclease ABC subunit UvrA [Candidatus Heimdallarchaeota archaeon]|nr:excinuclease ABC subunit UvrA [Candidatus Heimdallarchaeota archaeon]